MAKQHDERRAELIEAARQQFFSRGYDTCTVNDIIDAVGIAKGTFYHYFSGKSDLLAELIESLTDDILQQIDVIAGDGSRSALDRIEAYFQESMTLKAHSPEMMQIALETLYRPENTLLRVGMVERSNDRVAPVLGGLVREGTAAGEFDVADPELCGEYIIRSFATLSDRAARIVLAEGGTPAVLPELHRLFDFMEWTMARLLGVTGRPLKLIDRAVADALFGTIHPPVTHTRAGEHT
ncbi:MAG: TetR/AcrR family transcriptional regulator [Spirochaeta sp.]|jgi:AcrR family transcriptional regulator|nr:TetR/AcrR family transcriptional regulator [Spirochaeta sp.]